MFALTSPPSSPSRGHRSSRLRLSILLFAVLAVFGVLAAVSAGPAVAQVTPGVPTESVGPAESTAPAETTAPAEPTAPVGDPTAPAESTPPPEPTGSIAPTEPSAPTDSAGPTETATPTDPATPTETATPTESATPTEPAGTVLTLTQSSTRSAVGEMVTLTVTMAHLLDANAPVIYILDGPEAGTHLDMEGGPRQYVSRYRGWAAGVNHFVAGYPGDGPPLPSSNVVEHTWEDLAVTLSPDGESSLVGTTHQLTATIPGDPRGITFTVTDGPNKGREGFARAPGNTWTYSSSAAGTDTIVASVVEGEGSIESEPVTQTWTNPVGVDVALAPRDASTCVGSPFDVTVTTTSDGYPVMDVPVDVRASGEALPLITQSVRTDSSGSATASITRDTAGTETVSASVGGRMQITGATPVTHTWIDCGGLGISLTPAGTTSLVGSPFTVTAVVDYGDGPLANTPVDFRASLPGGQVQTWTVRTDELGHASFTYTRQRPGTEEIMGLVSAFDLRGEATVSHRWVAEPGLAVSLAPPGTTSVTGSPFTATVLASSGRRPLEGAVVRFRSSRPGEHDITSAARTNASGLASLRYSRPTAGTDVVTAEVTAGRRRGQASVTHFWVAAANLGLRVDPAGTANRVGETFTATTAFTDGGRPVADADVTFRVSAPGEPDIIAVRKTRGDGRATFSYSRATIGTDTVSAEASVGSRTATASIAHLWRTDLVVPPVAGTRLLLDRPSTLPGGKVVATGGGCAPGSGVTLVVAGRNVATVTSGAEGSYTAPLNVPDLDLGRYTLTANCSDSAARTMLDLVAVTSSSGAAVPGAATAAAVLAFFALLGGFFLRFR